jgi:hypothetical protein
MWTFQAFTTALDDAETANKVTVGIGSVIRGFTVNDTVGDEYFIKGGDLILKVTSALPFIDSSTVRNWLALYRGAFVYNVYYLGTQNDELDYRSYDYKNDIYEVRLPSIQSIFINDLKNAKIEYTTDTDSWNFNLINAKVTIDKIRRKTDTGTYIDTLNRAGFSIADMLGWAALQTNDHGYYFQNPNTPIPTKNDDDLPIIYRGASKDTNDTAQNIIECNFSDYDMTWADIFKLGSFAFNAFIRVVPVIGGTPEKLSLGFQMLQRRADAVLTEKTVEWDQLRYLKHRYKVAGVKLTGGNFEYNQGDADGGDAYSKSVGVFDPEISTIGPDESLYWSVGDYDSPSGKYKILDGSDNPRPYFASGLVESNYADMITKGHGYAGTFPFDGEKIFDEIEVESGGDIIRVLSLSVDEADIAQVEGIVID